MGTINDIIAISKNKVTTYLTGAAGVVTNGVVTKLIDKINVLMILNGPLAGLVAITAEPLNPIPAHMFSGIFETLIVPITNLDRSFEI